MKAHKDVLYLQGGFYSLLPASQPPINLIWGFELFLPILMSESLASACAKAASLPAPSHFYIQRKVGSQPWGALESSPFPRTQRCGTETQCGLSDS